MPLHHWPNPRVAWKSFHSFWITKIAEHLNQVLPPGFQARPTELLVGIEPDALILDQAGKPEVRPTKSEPALKAATLSAVLDPPAELPLVGIYSHHDETRLVAAVELASPGNKDRAESLRAFIEKALFLLYEGVHLLVIDVIRQPRVPLRKEMLKRLNKEDAIGEERAWISSYCAIPGEDPRPRIEVREWAYDVGVGEALPVVPLFLRADQLWVMVDLEASYSATLQAGRYRPS
ncbi:MAG: DUF4058 family protein [Planctomycetes bacterium]|nr:DUF4058 family protein [Planctomycetota bacterium]